MTSNVVLPELPAGRPLLVAIDGCSGAGKSTLARAITSDLPDTTVVHADDFCAEEPEGWEHWTPAEAYAGVWDFARLERDLLRPLRRGDPGAYNPYDWDTRTVGTATVVVPATTIVVVESVSVLRPELRGYWDFSIYVDTPADERHRRIFAREEDDELHIGQWIAAEDYYCENHRPWEVADVIVSGSKSGGAATRPSFILPR